MKNLILIIALLASNITYCQYIDIDWNTQDNCQHQTMIYYDNGNLKEVGCHNSNLQRIGQWSMYSVNGTRIAVIGFDLNGNKHGDWLVWSDNGEITKSFQR